MVGAVGKSRGPSIFFFVVSVPSFHHRVVSNAGGGKEHPTTKLVIPAPSDKENVTSKDVQKAPEEMEKTTAFLPPAYDDAVVAPSTKSPGGGTSSGDDDESIAAMVNTIVSAMSVAMGNPPANTSGVLAPGAATEETAAAVEETAVKTGAVGVPACVAGEGKRATSPAVKTPVVSDDAADMPALVDMRASFGSVGSAAADEEEGPPLPVRKVVVEEPGKKAVAVAAVAKGRVSPTVSKVPVRKVEEPSKTTAAVAKGRVPPAGGKVSFLRMNFNEKKGFGSKQQLRSLKSLWLRRGESRARLYVLLWSTHGFWLLFDFIGWLIGAFVNG